MINLENHKLKMASARGIITEDLISDTEFILLEKDYFISMYGSHVLFWEAFINWCETEFLHTRDMPMCRLYEKQALLQALNGYDINLIGLEEHTRLYMKLVYILNGSASTLIINRLVGGKNSIKLKPDVKSKILSRYEELKLQHPTRYKTAHMQTLSEEFKISGTSLKSILPKKDKRLGLS